MNDEGQRVAGQIEDKAEPGWRERLAGGDTGLCVHLMGIGGAGLSAIATVLLEMGFRVTGSDSQPGARTRGLAAAGAVIYPQQTAANLLELAPEQRPDVVLISSAIRAENPECRAAEVLGIPVVKRRQFLPALLARRTLIAVAGAHGKSTTTAMIAMVLHEAGIEAGYIIGAEFPGYGNAGVGRSDYFVLEADEYDGMFLGLHPKVAVVTNVEWDHPDCYPTPASFQRAFMQFVDGVDRDGLIVSCADDPGAENLRTYGPSRGRWIVYGTAGPADLLAVHPQPTADGGYRAELLWQQAPIGALRLQVPGLHNLRNAMAVLCVAHHCGVDMESALTSLARFRGTARRFELKGEVGGVTVIDDYAHHPTKVAATLAAARDRYAQRRIWAIFQPHTYSRTRHLLRQIGESFGHADRAIVTDIYAAREQDDGSVSAADLVAASAHADIRYIPSLEQVAGYLAAHVVSGDVVIILGAGDSYRVGEMLLEALRARGAG